MSGDEKPTRKYTKAIKEEIKKEPPFELSDNDDIDGDDVMDIEEADGTLPRKGKLGVNGAKKKMLKTKKVKKVLKSSADQKDKLKPKRKKKPLLNQGVGGDIQTSTPTANSKSNQSTSEPSTKSSLASSGKKILIKPKEKKIKPKVQKGVNNNNKKGGEKEQQQSHHNNSDSDSSPEESDAYETCGVLNCTRPSGMLFFLFLKIIINSLFQHLYRIRSRLDFVRWRM